MDEITSGRWIRALAGRVFAFTLGGALLCGLTGALLGAWYGGWYQLYDNLHSYNPATTYERMWFQFEDGATFGGFVGTFLGCLMGSVLFFCGAWYVSPERTKLWEKGGVLRNLVALVPAGQAIGSLAVFCAIAILQLLRTMTFDHATLAVAIPAALEDLMLTAPLGMLLGGMAAGILAINRAKVQRLRERNNSPLPTPLVDWVEVGPSK